MDLRWYAWAGNVVRGGGRVGSYFSNPLIIDYMA